MPPLKGIVFDLGGTLVEYHNARDWERDGLTAFHNCLAGRGYAAPPVEDLLAIHERLVNELHDRLKTDPHATLTQDDTFRIMLAETGVAPAPADWDAARERYYAASLPGKATIPGAGETLGALHAKGLKLAALSNTIWPAARLDQMLDRLGLLPYLPVRFYSCEEAAWKPWPAIFKRTLHALNLAPTEAAYVGDYYRFDIRGAQGAGMRAVWLRQPGREPEDGVVPDAEIDALPQLLDVAAAWMEGA
ncbi:MAG: HAD family hydrolase [Anaerolineae bacterium]|nr:HAD family hydrolase [Anaerolineae bacterium]